MTPDECKATYRRMMDAVGEDIAIRIYAGSPGARTHTDYPVRARVKEFAEKELVGPIVQGDRKVVLLAEDVAAAGVTLSTGQNCKLVVRSKELAIKSIDDNTRRLAGTVIAYDLRVGG